MQLESKDSTDPIGTALLAVVTAAGDHTQDQPLTPELFWEFLSATGFSVKGNPPGGEEHGRFFAHLVLDHAVATSLITGNTAQHHYWPR